MAGATLMALGNGAPDVFTAWNAIHQASDLPFVLGELLGGVDLHHGGRSWAACCWRRLPPQTTRRSPSLEMSRCCRPVRWRSRASASDGLSDFNESGAIILLYIAYVCVVVLLSHDQHTRTVGRRERVAALERRPPPATATVRWTGRGDGRRKWNWRRLPGFLASRPCAGAQTCVEISELCCSNIHADRA